MRTIIKFVSVNTLFFLLGIVSPIYSTELRSLFLPEITLKDRLLASNNNVKTVITKGFGDAYQFDFWRCGHVTPQKTMR